MQKIILAFFILFSISPLAISQETNFSRYSIKTGIGVAINEGNRETGMGILYSFGVEKSFLKNKRLRLNPNIHTGSFAPRFITDTRDQYYRVTSLELLANFDALKYKSVSVVLSAGGFLNYSRGLLGTGGMPEVASNSSEYFHKLYLGGSLGIGIRINSKNSKFAYELRPLNIHLGNNFFMLGYLEFGIAYKFPLKEK